MICVTCHMGSPRTPIGTTFVAEWRIRAEFIAQHIGHNRAWGRRWANSFRRAVTIGGPSGTAEERDALESLWKEFARRLA